MASHVRINVFELVPSLDPKLLPVPTPRTHLNIEHAGDATKEAARTRLAADGWTVRSLNWGPGKDLGGPPELIAYVFKPEKKGT